MYYLYIENSACKYINKTTILVTLITGYSDVISSNNYMTQIMGNLPYIIYFVLIIKI